MAPWYADVASTDAHDAAVAGKATSHDRGDAVAHAWHAADGSSSCCCYYDGSPYDGPPWLLPWSNSGNASAAYDCDANSGRA